MHTRGLKQRRVWALENGTGDGSTEGRWHAIRHTRISVADFSIACVPRRLEGMHTRLMLAVRRVAVVMPEISVSDRRIIGLFCYGYAACLALNIQYGRR